MATGKSTVGRLVAARMRRRFVDLDEEIERAARKTVPEIFKEGGEPAFRRLEAEALAWAVGETDLVVACGGGAPCFGDNLTRMRGAGIVVALRASLETVLRRAGLGGGRPLLRDAERLYREREEIYARADVTVETDGRDPDSI